MVDENIRLHHEWTLGKPKSEASFAASDGSDEAELRRMLAWAYSGHHLYCDDGEMQDSREQPFIDFKRDTISELKDKMEQRGLNRLHRELHQNAEFRNAASTASNSEGSVQ